MTHMFIRIPAPKIGGQNLSNGTASERFGKDADYNRLSMKHGSAASARRAASALFVGNGFAFGVWLAHISVFKQNYQLSNAQLTIPLFTLALGAILSMPVSGRVFHRLDSSAIIWKGLICYAVNVVFSSLDKIFDVAGDGHVLPRSLAGHRGCVREYTGRPGRSGVSFPLHRRRDRRLGHGLPALDAPRFGSDCDHWLRRVFCFNDDRVLCRRLS
jgi:hypothetical protein